MSELTKPILDPVWKIRAIAMNMHTTKKILTIPLKLKIAPKKKGIVRARKTPKERASLKVPFTRFCSMFKRFFPAF